jgi:hypothetical protein
MNRSDIADHATNAGAILADIQDAAHFAAHHCDTTAEASAVLRLVALAAERAHEHCDRIEKQTMHKPDRAGYVQPPKEAHA